MNTIKIETKKGFCDVPAICFDAVEGLAVTMTNFGFFEITHIKSGFLILGGFERYANAVVEMLNLYLAMCDANVNPNSLSHLFKQQIKNSNHKSEHLGGLTILEYLQVMRPIMGFSGEFPWEDEDDNPHVKATKLIKRISELNK